MFDALASGDDAARGRLITWVDADMAPHYAAGPEQARLSGWGRLEFVRTSELLRRHLPPPPAVVLDVGGGPGGVLAAARIARFASTLSPLARALLDLIADFPWSERAPEAIAVPSP